jgi:pimeloyl-ACP methyl ester carboxylesterase
MPYTTAQSIRIHRQVESEGPPLAIQHGFTDRMTTRYGLEYVGRLKHDDRLTLVDARGRSHSDNPHDSDAYGMEHVAGEVVAVLDPVNRPQLDLPEGKWLEREPDDTAFAARPRPRCRGWQLAAMAAGGAVGLVACLSLATAAAPASAAAAAPVPVLAWQPCTDPRQQGFDCATAEVPMDYSQPTGKTFTLALIKSPAQDPDSRIGTLFWNPGGPSDAGTQYLPASVQGFPEQVQRRFDIISWDPRGMGGDTTPVVQCFDSQEQEERFLEAAFSDLPAIAVSPSELARSINAWTLLNKQCVRRNGELLAHVSTADNARDLDLLRQAVGDEQTTYYGTSYGTFLGATYLNMFPDQVRAAVLDGAVSPRAWAGNDGDAAKLSTFLRIGSDIGTSDTIREFMNQCGEVDTASCAFSDGSPEATQRKWAELLSRLQASPVTTSEPIDGLDQPVDDRSLLSYVASSIYILRPLPGFGRFPGWVAVGEALQQVWEASEGAVATATAPPPPATVAASTPPATASTYITSIGRQPSVVCGESPNPETKAAYAKQALISYQRAGLTVWPFTAMCLQWSIKASSPYLGPWDRPTPAVLVIGNTFDPATPYSSSQRMADELWDGHLLTVDGFGHTVLLNPSRCAQDYVASYLIDGKLPPTGARCAQDSPPFSR